MKVTRSSYLILLFFFLAISSCREINPPSQTLDKYITRPEVDEALAELYFYPTTVRMLDKFISNGEGGILDGVIEGRLFYGASDSLDILKRDMPELVKGLENEGFELLAEFKSGDTKTVAFVRDESIDRYVALIGGGDVATMLVELKGEISIETLRGLSDLNSDNIMSLLEFTGGETNPVEEAPRDTTYSDTLKTEI